MQIRRIPLVMVVVVAGLGLGGTAKANTTPSNIPYAMRDLAATVGAYDVVVRTDEVLNALTYSVFTLTNLIWDDARGIYHQDCSGFVRRILEYAVPEAYDEIRDFMGVSRPRAEDYHDFFRAIPRGEKLGRWRRPSTFSYARPGDVLVWKYDVESASGTSGHAMIIVSVPERDSRYSNVYQVRVADSARSGHSNDNRSEGESGVGAGFLMIRVDSAGQPIQYAWKLTSTTWHDDISIAVGRPRY